MKYDIEKQFADEQQTLAEGLATWARVRERLVPIIEKLEALEVEPRFYLNHLTVSFAGDKHKLADVVRVLRGAGFATEDTPPQKDSTSWTAWYRHPDETALFVYLRFSSSVCTRIKVGTVMTEMPVYEVRCSEEYEV